MYAVRIHYGRDSEMSSAKKLSWYTRNLSLAKQLWFGQIKREQKYTLKFLTESYGLSIAAHLRDRKVRIAQHQTRLSRHSFMTIRAEGTRIETVLSRASHDLKVVSIMRKS